MVKPKKKPNSNKTPMTSTVKTLQEDVDNIRQKQDEQNKKLHEKLENVQDIREKQEKILEMFEKMQETKKAEIPIPIPPKKPAVFDLGKEKSSTPTSGKEFVIRHVFKNVSSMKEGEDGSALSNMEEHFGIPWKIKVRRENGYLDVYLHCNRVEKGYAPWSLDACLDMRIYSKNGKWCSKSIEIAFGSNGNRYGKGWNKFLKWNELMKDYVINDSITVEAHVKINTMNGVYKGNQRNFDVDTKKYSDVVVVVGEKKFYVLKLYLATHSPYFEALFLGQFQESKKTEVSLTGIDADDFQNYLEVLYGHSAIDETTVEGILFVADKYDTIVVTGRCEQFLVEKSEKSVEKMLEMATRFNLDQLKRYCYCATEQSRKKKIWAVVGIVLFVFLFIHELTSPKK